MPLDAEDDISDEALLVLYANGDPAAARNLTLRLTPRVFGHAFRLLGDRAEAEDVAQEGCLGRRNRRSDDLDERRHHSSNPTFGSCRVSLLASLS